MAPTGRLGLVVVWTFVLGLGSLALSGCKGEAQAPAPPPSEVTVIEPKPGMVTVYNEYVAQTQAPDTIEIRSQVTHVIIKGKDVGIDSKHEALYRKYIARP